MANEKPRGQRSNRDLIYSLIPLVVLCLIIAAIASQCSFSPGGPKSGPVPNFDVDAALTADSRVLSFPIRNPKVPDGWQPNSGSRQKANGPGGGEVSTVGYITKSGAYMQFSQSSAAEETLVPTLLGERSATGTDQVDERTWVVYAEEGEEPAWVADFTQVRILIRGAGTAADFTDLARAADRAQPLSR